MLGAVALALVVAVLLFLARGLLGPSVYDRILATNSLGTTTVLLVCVLGFLADRPLLFLDVALVYALINFVTTVAILKMVQEARLD